MTEVGLPRIVVVGVGGLGCPALWALAGEAPCRLLLVDDDVVEASNLGRQVLFDERDVGLAKVRVAADWLVARGWPRGCLELRHERFAPHNARALVRGASVVLEGSDDYATKFLCADACHLEAVPIVHGAAIAWRATVWSVPARGGPCYRCLFEDVPEGAPATCATSGVIGPVTGIAGALMAELALERLLHRDAPNVLYTYDGKADALRRASVSARADCPLCGRTPRIFAVDDRMYPRHTCAEIHPRSHADERYGSHSNPT